MVTNHCLSLTYQRCLILFSPILLKIFCIICWLVIFLFVHSVKFTHRYTSADHHHDLSHVLKSLQLFHNDSLILFILLFSFISFSILTSKFLNYYLTSLDCDEICIIFTIFNVQPSMLPPINLHTLQELLQFNSPFISTFWQ